MSFFECSYACDVFVTDDLSDQITSGYFEMGMEEGS